MTLNKKTEGTELYEIIFTPKGINKTESIYVYAKNRLQASQHLIINKMWGKQHEIKLHSTNLLK